MRIDEERIDEERIDEEAVQEERIRKQKINFLAFGREICESNTSMFNIKHEECPRFTEVPWSSEPLILSVSLRLAAIAPLAGIR
jgi:hypothetical protein